MITRVWTITKIELHKLSRQKIVYGGFFLVITVVVISVLAEKSLEGDSLSPVNGFGPLLSGGMNGFKMAAFIILVLGGLLFASETTFGTLKTILIAPVRRSDLILAKVLTVIISALILTLLIEFISFFLAWVIYGFAPVTDPTFSEMVHLSKKDMFIYMAYAFLHIVLPLIAIGLMGLLISTLVENAGIAVAVSIVLYLVFDFLIIELFENLSSYLFNYYLNYYLAALKNISEGVMQEVWKFRALDLFFRIESEDSVMLNSARFISVVKSIVIPVVYMIMFVVASIVAVKRKNA
jgi:ABC-type transport system involved in multi-copper enzyme maturation permease subunit